MFLTADFIIFLRWVRFIYMQECSVLSLICLLFPSEQCQSLKPVLSQCSQTGFVTVDDFIALYTRSYVFYSHGCSVFIHVWMFFFILTDTASIPMGVMYLHARMFCALAHTSSIPMSAMSELETCFEPV